MDSATPPPALARSLSPPVVGQRARGGGRGALDHSLVGLPSAAFRPHQAHQHSLDHSLAAPAGWFAQESSADGTAPDGGADSKGIAGSSKPGGTGARAGGATIDLLVVVVDETFGLPRLSGAPKFHGRVHDLRGLSAQLSGDELVAQCVQGVPVVSTRGGRWCLCWSEAMSADEHSDHELGAPGSRIEVIEEPAVGTAGGVARVLEKWTLAEAGIETDDVLWCRYLMVRS